MPGRPSRSRENFFQGHPLSHQRGHIDSARFWALDEYEAGRGQHAFDKQFVRDYLETLDWDKTPPAPKLPDEVTGYTTTKYREIFELLTGRDWS